jgi:VWFA-related protein
MPRLAVRARCAVAALVATVAASAAVVGQQPAPVTPPAGPASAPSFDLVVVDKDGRVPDILAPGDLTVSVDGKPRRVAAVRRVSRGPGASTDAATRQARANGSISFAAEPIRNVLVVVDQSSLVRGEERAAVATSRALLDRLGVADRLAVVLLPLPTDQMLSLATEQPAARETLARTAGQIAPATLARPDAPALPAAGNPMLSDPERLRESEPVPVAAPAPIMKESDAAPSAGTLGELAGLLDAIRTVPGRKVVALFSAGLADMPSGQVSDVAAAAVAARAAIHVFAVPGPRDDGSLNLQMGPLETLARSTGGAFVSAGRNPERLMTRTASELAACYVVALEPAATDTDGKRHMLKVEVAARGLTVRAPAWLMPSADPGDLPVSAPAPAAVPSGDTRSPRTEAAARPTRPPEPPSGREAEFQLAMARLVDYVDAYERQYSGLVAEEEFRQSTRGSTTRLRSDYLLVKPERSAEWISFRDVYEVDGVAVRDRDDRLKRLFLQTGIDISVQLQAIRDESARYNLGIVERNINVPLFLLRFLQPENRPRFRFRLAGSRSVAGGEAWRIEFDERVSPTIISDRQGSDVDAKGWFFVDQVTGAIVESVLRIEENGSTGEIKVLFRHDPVLGMWVPAEMTETYQMLTQRSLSGVPRAETIVEGRAKYANYRRFQVRTEEKIVIPK